MWESNVVFVIDFENKTKQNKKCLKTIDFLLLFMSNKRKVIWLSLHLIGEKK